MYLSYYDESGDDGYPKYSSPIFLLSACYLHYLNWKETYQSLRDFRVQLKSDFSIPVKMEFHAKPFILNKNPYSQLGLSETDRIKIVDYFCDLISALKLKILNVVIVKKRIKLNTYNVMDRALTYSIQRIENDLNPRQHPEDKFIILTDPGRVSKMRNTSRKLQRINYIPSKFGPESYRREIQSLIEDPLEKESKESFFIQLCDLVAFVVYSYSLLYTKSGKLHGRIPSRNQHEILEKLDGEFETKSEFSGLRGQRVWDSDASEIKLGGFGSRLMSPPTVHSRFQWFKKSIVPDRGMCNVL